jgi:hypothetical protein
MLAATRYHLSCPRAAAGNLSLSASKSEIGSSAVGSDSRIASIVIDEVPHGFLAQCYNWSIPLDRTTIVTASLVN